MTSRLYSYSTNLHYLQIMTITTEKQNNFYVHELQVEQRKYYRNEKKNTHTQEN